LDGRLYGRDYSSGPAVRAIIWAEGGAKGVGGRARMEGVFRAPNVLRSSAPIFGLHSSIFETNLWATVGLVPLRENVRLFL
jgi:hypothetical protein